MIREKTDMADMENLQSEPKTFTQEEVNAIIGERIGREREKYADYEALKEKAVKFDEMEEASKTELQRATEKAAALETELLTIKKSNEVREVREKVAKDTGVPAHLLSGETEEACMDQAYAILSYKNESKAGNYPAVKDGGEVSKVGKPTTRQQFAEWVGSLS